MGSFDLLFEYSGRHRHSSERHAEERGLSALSNDFDQSYLTATGRVHLARHSAGAGLGSDRVVPSLVNRACLTESGPLLRWSQLIRPLIGTAVSGWPGRDG